jgi:KDO2-lipid IV(A) lauroyltransferase
MAAELTLTEKVIPRFNDYVSAKGLEILDKALTQKKGVIAIVSHFGNWEWMGGWLSLNGYTGGGVARKIYYEKYDKLIMSIRRSMKIKAVIDRNGSARDVLKALKQNQVLAFAVDQDVETVDGVFVEFFGQQAFTPTAPVRFALSTGTPMIPLFILRKGMHHQIFVLPPIELTETGDKEKDILLNTQKWISIQEQWIRQYPEQWVWNHKRWKTTQKDLVKDGA